QGYFLILALQLYLSSMMIHRLCLNPFQGYFLILAKKQEQLMFLLLKCLNPFQGYFLILAQMGATGTNSIMDVRS
ncbi:MAG: hypothetical protein ACRCZO_17270, partial [Cetobacterium sp.]